MPPKARRSVEEAEVCRRWSTLCIEERRAVTHFSDAALVRSIRDAVQAVYEKQTCLARLGMRPGGVAALDLFVGSALLKEVFDLQWVLEKSEEFPDAVLMDPEEQPSSMFLHTPILEGELLLDRLRFVLPDVLGARTGRVILPKVRWKQLWTPMPSSVPALEQQLVKLMEQALWSMTTNPAYDVSRHGRCVNESADVDCKAVGGASASGVASCGVGAASTDVVFEEWMLTEPSLTASSGKKKLASAKKKRSKKKRSCELELAIGATAEDTDSDGEGAAEGALQGVEGDGDEQMQALASDLLAADNSASAVCADSGPAGGRMGQAGNLVTRTKGSTEGSLLHHATVVSALEEEVCLEESMKVAIDVATQPPASSESITFDRESVLRNHYWTPREESPKERKPMFGWCLPSFSRGHWSRSARQQDVQLKGVQTVVRNTFIEVDVPDPHGPGRDSIRQTRSLSPVATRPEPAEYSSYFLSLSTNEWHR